jgi:hypothetical protein
MCLCPEGQGAREGLSQISLKVKRSAYVLKGRTDRVLHARSAFTIIPVAYAREGLSKISLEAKNMFTLIAVCP